MVVATHQLRGLLEATLLIVFSSLDTLILEPADESAIQ